MANVIRIKPFHYIHVLDNNTNLTRLEVGPQTFTRQEHEKVVLGPEPMIMIPPRSYCVVTNPVVVDAEGNPEIDLYGNYKLKHGDTQIRREQEPFPLYPGEVAGKVLPLQVVAANSALRLRAVRDFQDGDVVRASGDEWLFIGPGTYIPRVEEETVEVVRSTIIKQNEALKLRALKTFTDRTGAVRKAGEEYLFREIGAYLPAVEEEIVCVVKAHVLTDKKALHLRATRTFIDQSGKKRRAGEEWLVTIAERETHICDVSEVVVGEVHITTLSNRQYCVVLDPVDRNGVPCLGTRELRQGECSFFLQPGERLENGIQSVHVLGEEEALLLRARESFVDSEKKSHLPGDQWMIYGPCDYVPSVEVEIVGKRRSIPLDENEGIYVRDIKTGEVRSVVGRSYMLKENEEAWEKKLPEHVLDLLGKTTRGKDDTYLYDMDTSRVVTYRAPHNSAVQLYDYKRKKARVVFGPELVMLEPDEYFTVLSLSGGRPKRPNMISSLCLFLGPDFMTDLVTVETSDHARLNLQLAYNWHFDVDPNSCSQAEASKIFAVPDFVGDACKAIASRVRGAVAASSFDAFHKNSSEIIKQAVFSRNKEGKLSNQLVFTSNNLVITNIDIQSVEPVDQRTRDSLQKSVQLAIEITTKSQEAAARQEAERLEQQARGQLERQRIADEARAEESRKKLLELQAQSAAVESLGQASAEARSRAQAAEIEGTAAVKQAELRAEATRIQAEGELAQLKMQQEADIAHQKALIDHEISKAKELAEIESKKFKDVVDAIGADTITAIAQAGPEMQAKLLQGLGLKSFLITDGHSPVNLFGVGQGLLGKSDGNGGGNGNGDESF